MNNAKFDLGFVNNYIGSLQLTNIQEIIDFTDKYFYYPIATLRNVVKQHKNWSQIEQVILN